MSSNYCGTGGNNCSNGNCPEQTITAPTKTQYQDIYKKQLVRVIHPIEIVRRYHCSPVYQHSYVYTVRDEAPCATPPVQPDPGNCAPAGASINSFDKKKAASHRKAGVSSKMNSRKAGKRVSKRANKRS